MSMVCPTCKKAYQLAMTCPACKVRLLYQAQSLKGGNLEDSDPGAHWQQTPWGRMIVGLVLAQGLSFGLQQLLTAWLLASGDDGSKQVWATLWGLALLHSVQGLSLLFGGALTGAGQHRGMLYGAFVGLVNGLIFLVVQRQSGEVLNDLALFGQPLLHMVFGGLGGLIGQQIWKPLPRVKLPEDLSPPPPPVIVPAKGLLFLTGPVHLVRIFVGSAFVVTGVLFSGKILEFVINTGQGKLSLSSHLQAQLVAWEIAGLVIVIGSGLAGATTFNGLKQGLCVGVASSLIYIGTQLANPKANLESVLFMLITMIGFGLIGGWFGGQLFPPVARSRRRHSILSG